MISNSTSLTTWVGASPDRLKYGQLPLPLAEDERQEHERGRHRSERCDDEHHAQQPGGPENQPPVPLVALVRAGPVLRRDDCIDATQVCAEELQGVGTALGWSHRSNIHVVDL